MDMVWFRLALLSLRVNFSLEGCSLDKVLHFCAFDVLLCFLLNFSQSLLLNDLSCHNLLRHLSALD